MDKPMKKKILIGGCSFSQHTGFPTGNVTPLWTSWTDVFERDFSNKFNIINTAQSSFGQGMISQSIVRELIKYNFDIDHVIIQWSGITRAYALSETKFIEKVIRQTELQFLPYSNEYIVNGNKEDWVTDTLNTVSSHFYTYSLYQIFLTKCMLESKNIPYTMFWGWEQITPEIEAQHKQVLDLIYDENFWRFNEHGGMAEYTISKLGREVAILKGDFHLTTVAQSMFYEDIIKKLKFL